MEQWKLINNYEDYSISNFGQVKSNRFNRILRPGMNGSGYFYVNIIKNKRKKTTAIHRLVIEHFGHKKPDENFVVDHLDGNKTNNSIDNLEWVSIQENTIRYYGNNNKNDEILKLKSHGLTLTAISKKLNLGLSIVQRVIVDSEIA
jgi:hypothetical protein